MTAGASGKPGEFQKLPLDGKRKNAKMLGKSGGCRLLQKADYSIRSIGMSFKLLKIGMDALRRARIGRAALVAAALCVATAPSPSYADEAIHKLVFGIS